MKLVKRLFLTFVICFVVAGVAAPLQSEAASIKLNKTKTTVYAGKKTTLKVKNTKKKVKWSTSKKSVATVSSKGVVTGKKHGTATITAKVGNKKYTCKVTVKARLNKTKATVKAKETVKLSVTGKSKTIKWSSSKKSVATVSSKGVVTAKKAGTTTITAKMGTYKMTCKVTVVPKISKTSGTLYSGKTTKLYVYGATSTVKWSSSKTSVATVSSSGTVTAQKAGTATITGKVGTKKYTCKVTVKSVYDTDTRTLSFVNAGMVELRTVKVTKVTAVSADPSIASVVEYDKWLDADYGYVDYVVYGHNTGTTTITITNNYSNEELVIPVTVTKPENPDAYQRMVDHIIANGVITESGDMGVVNIREEGDDTIVDTIAYSVLEESLVFGTALMDETEEAGCVVGFAITGVNMEAVQATVVSYDAATEDVIMAMATIEVASYDGSDVTFVDVLGATDIQGTCNDCLRDSIGGIHTLLTQTGFTWADFGFTALLL